MSTATIQTFTRFSELPPALAVKILSYTPVTALAFVSKTLHSLQEKAMEQEWRAMKSNPLLAERISALPAGDFSPICFRLLLDQQRGLAERTPAGFNAFTRLQRLEVGSYSPARFEKAEQIIIGVDREQEYNLWQVWSAHFGLRTLLRNQLGDTPPESVPEIRTWMNAAENQVHLDTIDCLNVCYSGLTAFPPEIAKCRFLTKIIASSNAIRELPDWFAQFSLLKEINMEESLIDSVPEVRLPNIEHIRLNQNPITKCSESAYRNCYTWRKWISGFTFREVYPSSGISFNESNLREIPFSLYLERLDPILSESVESKILESVFEYFDQIHWVLKVCALPILYAVTVVFTSYMWLHYLLNRCFVIGIIPIATWVREQLGYGRMIRLN